MQTPDPQRRRDPSAPATGTLPSDAPLPGTAWGGWRHRPAVRATLRVAPLLGAMALLLAVFAWLVPGFLRPDNLIDLVEQVSINGILAMGMTLTIMVDGINLSVGAVLALTGTVAVYVLTAGHPAAPSVLRLAGAVGPGLAVAAAFGAFNGLCTARTRMPPFIITLATMLVARGMALRFNQAQPISIPDAETAFLWLGTGRLFGAIPDPCW